jgi:hypothetical protein
MSKKYARNYNSIYATFLRSYQKAVAEFATQITVQSDEEQKPRYRRGVRTSLALGGIGAGYALGKDPEAQEVLKKTGTSLKDNFIDRLGELRSAKSSSISVPSLPTSIPEYANNDIVISPSDLAGKAARGASKVVEDKDKFFGMVKEAENMGLNPYRWLKGD